MAGTQLSIDLGTSGIRIAREGRGVILREPSVLAVDQKSRRVIAVGEEAAAMIGREPPSVALICPISGGAISDYDNAERILRKLVGRVCRYRLFKPCSAINVPPSVTEVEERSVVQAATSVGIRRVALVPSHLAAALGAGLPIEQAHGFMAADIGAGTTDVAALSLGEAVVSESVRTAGDVLDEAIVRMVRTRYGLVIGRRSAEELKRKIGSALPREGAADVRGRDAVSGLPDTRSVTAADVCRAMEEPLREIVETIQRVLEQTPPELVSDILEDGIMLTGGSAHLPGLPEYIRARTGVPCRVAEHPEDCVVLGTGMALHTARRHTPDTYHIDPFRYDRSDWMER